MKRIRKPARYVALGEYVRTELAKAKANTDAMNKFLDELMYAAGWRRATRDE